RPRPGSDLACVGVIGGTGPAGMRLTDRMPLFLSGVAFPDALVLGPEALEKGAAGVRAAGFFGLDWSAETGEFAWGTRAEAQGMDETLQTYLHEGREKIERFFGHPFEKSFDVAVFPDRKAFDAFFQARWAIPKTERWMVATGVADKLALLS